MVNSILSSKATRLFLILGGFFIANALIAEFIGVKIFSLEDTIGVPRANLPLFGGTFNFHLTAGVLLWPVVFIMTDIINEYYGPKGVKFLSYLTAGLITYAFVIVFAAIRLTPSEFFSLGDAVANSNAAFKGVFGQGLWIIFGSLVAFLIGQILDVMVFHRIKKWTGENKIWLRATGSTLVSQLIDLAIEVGEHFYTTDYFQLSAFNPAHQMLSVYYFVNPLGPFSVRLSKTPFDFDEAQMAAYELQNETQAFRFIPLQELNEDCVTLPIDKIVVGMLLNRFTQHL